METENSAYCILGDAFIHKVILYFCIFMEIYAFGNKIYSEKKYGVLKKVGRLFICPNLFSGQAQFVQFFVLGEGMTPLLGGQNYAFCVFFAFWLQTFSLLRQIQDFIMTKSIFTIPRGLVIKSPLTTPILLGKREVLTPF